MYFDLLPFPMKEVKLGNFLHRYLIPNISFLSQELQEILNINMPAKTVSVKSGKLLDILVNYFYNYFDLAGFEILSFTVTKYSFCTNHVQGTYFENVFRKEKVIAFSYPQSPQTNVFLRQNNFQPNPSSTSTAVLVCIWTNQDNPMIKT